MTLYIHTLGRFNNPTACSLYRILFRAAVSWIWWKWEIFCLKWELNPHLLHSRPVCELWHHLRSTLPTPTCLCTSLPERSVQTSTLTYAFTEQTIQCYVTFTTEHTTSACVRIPLPLGASTFTVHAPWPLSCIIQVQRLCFGNVFFTCAYMHICVHI